MKTCLAWIRPHCRDLATFLTLVVAVTCIVPVSFGQTQSPGPNYAPPPVYVPPLPTGQSYLPQSSPGFVFPVYSGGLPRSTCAVSGEKRSDDTENKTMIVSGNLFGNGGSANASLLCQISRSASYQQVSLHQFDCTTAYPAPITCNGSVYCNATFQGQANMGASVQFFNIGSQAQINIGSALGHNNSGGITIPDPSIQPPNPPSSLVIPAGTALSAIDMNAYLAVCKAQMDLVLQEIIKKARKQAEDDLAKIGKRILITPPPQPVIDPIGPAM